MLCRTKPHIWSLGPKIHNKSLVINLTFQRNCDFYWLWSFVGNIIKCFLLSKFENLRHVHHENSVNHGIRRYIWNSIFLIWRKKCYSTPNSVTLLTIFSWKQRTRIFLSKLTIFSWIHCSQKQNLEKLTKSRIFFVKLEEKYLKKWPNEFFVDWIPAQPLSNQLPMPPKWKKSNTNWIWGTTKSKNWKWNRDLRMKTFSLLDSRMPSWKSKETERTRKSLVCKTSLKIFCKNSHILCSKIRKNIIKPARHFLKKIWVYLFIFKVHLETL